MLRILYAASNYQGGGIPIYSVYSDLRLQSKLTEKIYHGIYFMIVGFIAEILLDLDHFDRIHQRDIVA